MTRQLDVDRLLENWLAEGPTELPDRAVDNIVKQLDEHQQRRLWLPGRKRMNRMIFAIGGVAAVVAVVFLGYRFYGNQPGVGGPPTSTGISPNAATPTPTATASPAPPAAKLSFGEHGINAPGRYTTDFQGYRYTFTVPTMDWASIVQTDVLGIVEKDLGDGDVFTGMNVLGTADELSTDACHWEGATSVPGPTVDDLVTALAAVKGFEASEPSDATIGGYAGKHVRLTVPADVNMADCDNGDYHGIEGFYALSPGQVQDIWVLDLDGTRSLLFTTWDGSAPSAPEEELAELARTLEIERVVR